MEQESVSRTVTCNVAEAIICAKDAVLEVGNGGPKTTINLTGMGKLAGKYPLDVKVTCTLALVALKGLAPKYNISAVTSYYLPDCVSKIIMFNIQMSETQNVRVQFLMCGEKIVVLSFTTMFLGGLECKEESGTWDHALSSSIKSLLSHIDKEDGDIKWGGVQKKRMAWAKIYKRTDGIQLPDEVIKMVGLKVFAYHELIEELREVCLDIPEVVWPAWFELPPEEGSA